jgi:selenide,water dikinase
MGPEALAQVLRPLRARFPAAAYPALLVGLEAADDAAVYRLTDDLAVVQTVDFFAPIVDDPWTFGAVAAVNAMSDVWAMGGEVALALHIAALPEDLPTETAAEIFRGSAEKVAEGGGVIAGGHTVYDREPKFGLCVTGLVHPDRIVTKGGLRPGDPLFLTKPLGTGLIVTAAKHDRADPRWLAGAVAAMLRPNRHPAHLAVAAGVRAMTDVTGFGLLGHADEMARLSGVGLRLSLPAVPVLDGARACVGMGVGTAGAGRNRAFLSSRVRLDPALSDADTELLYDPQTSGGLLIAVPPERAGELTARFAAEGLDLWRIGTAVAGDGIDVVAALPA